MLFRSVGAGSSTQDVTVTNTGLVPVGFVNAQIAGTNYLDFSVATSNCPAALVPGAACLIGIAERPTAAGAPTATLRVTTDAGVKTVALTGTAKNPADVNVWLSGPTTATAATPIATTVNVTNLGPTAAKGIQITLDIGTGGTFTSVSATG